ncbi:MAG: ATP-binding protein [Lachnospiraceae bacterium]|nr:ATP-binding protein [Lachnospiraceae bacterium]
MNMGKKLITLEAKTEKLAEITGIMDEMLEEADCDMKTQLTLDMALEEMFVNVAHYAYLESGLPEEKQTMDVEFEVENGKITITITDSGKPFDPLKKPDPDITLSAEERQIGGLGIYMVKQSMDNVSYEYKDGKNIFMMDKAL